MLFTNIQLDNFSPTLTRFIKHIEIEGAEEHKWIMMAGTGGPAVKVAKKCQVAPTFCNKDSKEKWMDVDDEGTSQASLALLDANTPAEFPVSFKLALELAFSMLSFILHNPTQKASPFAHSTLNPYISVMLTFLSTITKHAEMLSGLVIPTAGREWWSMLMSGCAPPLSKDWCLSGMEWIGRKVFERGYWKSGEERRMSMEVEILDVEEGGQLTDGIIEDEDDEEDGHSHVNGESLHGETSKRWNHLVCCHRQEVCGLKWARDGRPASGGNNNKDQGVWRVQEGAEVETCHSGNSTNTQQQLWSWFAAVDTDRLGTITAVELERALINGDWTPFDLDTEAPYEHDVNRDDSVDIDVDDEDAESKETSEQSEEDENDHEEVKDLKACWRYLQSLLVSGQCAPAHMPKQRSHPACSQKIVSMPSLDIVAGYTILVLDTNIILSSLSAVASIIESLRWTIVLPVPVIMELDGLSSNPSQLGKAAQEAIAYITLHIHSHPDVTEYSWDHCMDNLILKATIWQDEYGVDCSALLKNMPPVQDDANAIKVVLLSLDRLFHLKAHSHQLAAAGEKDLAAILASGT
ncbi:uncharacterized protein BJ212DRAFT_1482468 [Suillus subaureus]|uniref:EF-hand domain-containing protein n=1 Tax=Suillus subaureus TaxID=48587 RepID=A0A9P7E7K2_9AGAM|nr:uncharacterized protein BJ212DRAFT_1482468 [Suillus subaureus]KAG1813564.1 hypothetical protein BJ212DRAFT_1482468 [Suillus subaureus]